MKKHEDSPYKRRRLRLAYWRRRDRAHARRGGAYAHRRAHKPKEVPVKALKHGGLAIQLVTAVLSGLAFGLTLCLTQR